MSTSPSSRASVNSQSEMTIGSVEASLSVPHFAVADRSTSPALCFRSSPPTSLVAVIVASPLPHAGVLIVWPGLRYGE